MWLSLIAFILILFVCWNLFCTIVNLRIKCVTETENVSVLFCKNLKSSFSTWLTHLPLRFLYILGWSGPWCAAPGIPSSAIPDFDHYIGKWIKIQMYVQLLKYLCSDFWCDSTQKTSTLLYRSVLPWLSSAHRELNLPTQQVFLNRTVLFVILQSRFGKHCRVYQRKHSYFILLWRVEICKQVLVWRWFGIPE